MQELATDHPIQIEIAKLEMPNSYKTDLSQATALVITDRILGPVDFVYFFGRAFGDAKKDELYPEAVKLYAKGLARKIVVYGNEGRRVNGTVPEEAGPSMVRVSNRFQRMGVNPQDILFTPDDPRHTKAEGNALLKMASSNEWRKVAFIAHPHQVLRSMLGLVRTINEEGYDIEVYSVTPSTTDWDRRVFGSQGIERKSRREQIVDELVRIPLYQEKGDLASFDELSAYMTRRSQSSTPQPSAQGLGL